MKKALFVAAALALLSVPAFAQYGGGAQNSGGPLVSSRGVGGAAVAAPGARRVVRHKARKAVRHHRRHNRM